MFDLWDFVKNRVQSREVENLHDLRHRRRVALDSMTPEMQEGTREELSYSFDCVRTAHRAHVEVNGRETFSEEASLCFLNFALGFVFSSSILINLL
jgi:hypothetical protein